MTRASRRARPKPVNGVPARRAGAAGVAAATKPTRPKRSKGREAEETLEAIRAGRIDALVVRRGDSDALFALRSFVELDRIQADLRKAGADRRRSSAQLRALMEEKESLLQDLHDGCIQSIYAVGLDLEEASEKVVTEPARASQLIGQSIASLNLVIQEIRGFVSGHGIRLREGQGLRSEIDKAAATAARRGLTFSVDIDPVAASELTGEQSMQLVQIARECISNAMRHSDARSGRVSLGKQRGILRFEISDDGKGFAPGPKRAGGFGLHHIEMRARKIGGTARVVSAPGEGTRVTVRIGGTEWRRQKA